MSAQPHDPPNNMIGKLVNNFRIGWYFAECVVFPDDTMPKFKTVWFFTSNYHNSGLFTFLTYNTIIFHNVI